MEDSESIATSLALALERIPDIYPVLARDPRSALDLFRAAESDIAAIVTDLHLPFFDGFELIREIRAIEKYRELPAIMITADEQAAMPNGHERHSPNAIFRKPFSPKEVCRVLKELLP